jgi:hypothetical protein
LENIATEWGQDQPDMERIDVLMTETKEYRRRLYLDTAVSVETLLQYFPPLRDCHQVFQYFYLLRYCRQESNRFSIFGKNAISNLIFHLHE